MTNRDDVKIPCEYCAAFADDPTQCPYCYGKGFYLREWYYGLDQKIMRLGKTLRMRNGSRWRKGRRVKVVMCSRMGDVGITVALGRERGYDVRVDPEILVEMET